MEKWGPDGALTLTGEVSVHAHVTVAVRMIA
ncbi:UNVERIFIED_ORG: hypothetical protein CLV66_1263 [Actinomadura viridilutea]